MTASPGGSSAGLAQFPVLFSGLYSVAQVHIKNSQGLWVREGEYELFKGDLTTAPITVKVGLEGVLVEEADKMAEYFLERRRQPILVT